MADRVQPTVRVGEKEYPYKRVNIETIKKHLPFLKASAAQTTANGAAMDGLVEMAEIVHECIVRADPKVTFEEIAAEMDIETAGGAYATVMSGSAFAPPGGEKPAEKG